MGAFDWDIVGVSLAETWAATSDGCCSACDSLPGCEGFAYSNQWSTCYLKGNFTGLYHNPGVVSRIKSSLAGNCSGFQAAMEGHDLAGRTVIDFPSPDPQGCCLVCGRKEDCQGFAYFEDRCYLKADVSGTFDKQGCQVILKDGILSEAGGERRLSQAPPDGVRGHSCSARGVRLSTFRIGFCTGSSSQAGAAGGWQNFRCMVQGRPTPETVVGLRSY